MCDKHFSNSSSLVSSSSSNTGSTQPGVFASPSFPLHLQFRQRGRGVVEVSRIPAARIDVDIDVPVSRVLEHHDLDGARTRPITSEQLVTRTAQKALTRLGYGPLKADGVAGPGTRRAVEAFQRANALPITGELDAPTLQRLTPGKLAAQ